MSKFFEKPEIEIIMLDSCDIITTSGERQTTTVEKYDNENAPEVNGDMFAV